MDLDELRSAQSRERQASQLQHLRDGFYEEAASFIRGLRTERERVAANSEYSFPYDDPEVQRLTNEIQTAEEVVESLYERRVGKVVKMASFDAAGMAVDAEGLTTEESDLFETLVGDIEANRARVLDALAGTAGGDGSPGAGGGAGSTPESAPESASGSGSPTQPAANHERTAPEGDEPVHIGSEPTADGPVSTADGDARSDGEPPSEQAPTPGTDRGEAAGPESASRDASPSGATSNEPGASRDGPGAPDRPDDAMDAASAMGGSGGADTGSDGVPGLPDDADGGVPTDGRGTDTTAPADPPATADATDAAAVRTETADESGHQPVPPADGPPGPETGSGSAAPAGTGTEDGASAPDTPGSGAGTETSAATGDHPSGAADGAGPRATSDATGEQTPDEAAPSPGGDTAGANGTLVRITGDVGEIFGVDGRAYDLSADDVAVLPTDNAELLVQDGDAEPLDPAIAVSDGHSNRS